MAILSPFLEERADGRLVILNKGPLARALQEEVGDMIFTAKDGSARSVEVKIEQVHTGNLFLETWSNKNLDSRESHASRGSTLGWMYKVKADLLFYYFLPNDKLYVFDFFVLKRWAFGCDGREGRRREYKEVMQKVHTQMNDTWGCLVPIEDLGRELRREGGSWGYRLFYPKQLEFFENERLPFGHPANGEWQQIGYPTMRITASMNKNRKREE